MSFVPEGPVARDVMTRRPVSPGRLGAGAVRLTDLVRTAAWRIVLVDPLDGGAAVGATLLAVAAVGAIAALGQAGNTDVAILYLLPVLIATLLVGRDVGVAISAAAAVAWAVSERGEPLVLVALDAALRCAVMSVLVVLVEALRRTAARARRSDERTAAFLGLAAHQLRTPVAAIRASAEALLTFEEEGETAPATRDRLLCNVASDAARVGKLVEDLLAIVRLDADEPLPVSPTDIAACARSCVDGRVTAASHLQVRLRGTGRPLYALANADSCRHILENLLDNAYRHAREKVEVEVQLWSDWVRVCVADDGGGLPAGAEEVAFQPFVSLDHGGGSGLGLPLSRGLARSFGGELAYEKGRFVLSLRMARSDEERGVSRPGEPASRARRHVPARGWGSRSRLHFVARRRRTGCHD